jgi:hypothetical protein
VKLVTLFGGDREQLQSSLKEVTYYDLIEIRVNLKLSERITTINTDNEDTRLKFFNNHLEGKDGEGKKFFKIQE